jgi:hypothetical protein
MQEKPRSLLSDTERPRYFATADAGLGVSKHPHGRKPLVQTYRRVFHDGAYLNRELAARMPDAALPTYLVSQKPELGATATRAYNAVLPFRAARYNVVQAVGRIRKVADGFQQGLGFVKGFHTSSLPQKRVLVKYICALSSLTH